MVNGWAILIGLVAGGLVLGVAYWWERKKARESASDLAKVLADKHEATIAAQAEAEDQTARETALDKLNEAKTKTEKKVNNNGSLAGFLRDRGAGS